MKKLERNIPGVYDFDEVLDYLLRLIDATRRHPMIRQGASPRATLALTAVSQAAALIRGRDYVVPEDVKAVFRDVIDHRLIYAPQAVRDEKADPLAEVLRSVKAPAIR